MKKIKVVISDLHLGKGRLLEDGSVNALEEFYFAEKLVEFIQYYSTGIHRDCEVELIINGDFLNFLQVDFRGHFLTVFTESVCLEILKSIMDGHKIVFEAMAKFAAKSGNSITYVVGNHDQAMLWPACREYFNSVVGVPVRFKNIVYTFDGVHVEHGHMYEAANRLDPKKFFLRKNLAEPILNLPFGSLFFVELVLRIKHKYPHVDKIRPFATMVRWSLFNETIMTLGAFANLIFFLGVTLFRKDPRRQLTLKRLIQIFFGSAIFPDLCESARRILSDERVHTVIFGHSHMYQYRKWSQDQEYLNTGTWTELTSLDVESLGKVTKLTYAYLEYPEEGGGSSNRPRARLKVWRGFHRIEEDLAI